MKKLFFILLGFTLASGVFAQTVPQKAKASVEKKDLKGDIKQKRADQKVVRKDLSKGKVKKAKADHMAVKNEKKDINKDAARLERNGVNHPRANARKEIREEKNK